MGGKGGGGRGGKGEGVPLTKERKAFHMTGM